MILTTIAQRTKDQGGYEVILGNIWQLGFSVQRTDKGGFCCDVREALKLRKRKGHKTVGFRRGETRSSILGSWYDLGSRIKKSMNMRG